MTTATKSEFARRLGVSPSYVTKLLSQGRLVLTDDGLVDVEASEKLREKTGDPNRDDVRRRHQEKRAAHKEKAEAPAGPAGTAGKDDGASDPEEPPSRKGASSYALARANKEHYLFLSAKLDYEHAIGRVVDAEDVRRMGTEAGATLRTALENMTDQLAPLLAPLSDEAQVHAMLVEHVEAVLTEIGRKVEELGRQKPDGE